jgi:hypothetical protein
LETLCAFPTANQLSTDPTLTSAPWADRSAGQDPVDRAGVGHVQLQRHDTLFVPLPGVPRRRVHTASAALHGGLDELRTEPTVGAGNEDGRIVQKCHLSSFLWGGDPALLITVMGWSLPCSAPHGQQKKEQPVQAFIGLPDQSGAAWQ